jgi:hypothetical protein
MKSNIFNRNFLIALSTAVAISGTASAATGYSFAYSEPAGDDMVIGYDYESAGREAGINFSAEHNISTKRDAANWNQFSTGLYIGATKPLKGNAVYSYGLEGNITYVSSKSRYEEGDSIDHYPSTIGPYMGLAYKPNNNVKLFYRIMPISYETFGFESNTSQQKGKQNEIEFFNEGTFGIAYLF